MATATATDTREIVVNGARSVFTHTVCEDADLEKLINLLMSEIMARNEVVLVLCVGHSKPQVAILDD